MNRHLYAVPDLIADMLDAWAGIREMPRRPHWVSSTDWRRLKVVTQSLFLASRYR